MTTKNTGIFANLNDEGREKLLASAIVRSTFKPLTDETLENFVEARIKPELPGDREGLCNWIVDNGYFEDLHATRLKKVVKVRLDAKNEAHVKMVLALRIEVEAARAAQTKSAPYGAAAFMRTSKAAAVMITAEFTKSQVKAIVEGRSGSTIK